MSKHSVIKSMQISQGTLRLWIAPRLMSLENFLLYKVFLQVYIILERFEFPDILGSIPSSSVFYKLFFEPQFLCLDKVFFFTDSFSAYSLFSLLCVGCDCFIVKKVDLNYLLFIELKFSSCAVNYEKYSCFRAFQALIL